MVKCCIFDLDGTLVNSLNDLANAANNALAALGFPVYDIEKYKQFIGNGVAKLIERILPDNHKTDENKQKMRKLFDEKYDKCCTDFTKPYSHIRETLTELKKRNIILAVVTNKPDETAKKILNKLLPNIFDDIFGNTNDTKPKPAPDLCFQILKTHNINADDCVFIGDSNVDMQTAANARIISIGVTWGFRSRQELEQTGANFIINTPKELLELEILN
jgi:phosphoglycolate phosphatase